ncbi:MAG: hypothetical protein O4806_02615 [Trichodesmium sp. St5_bin8]|nr:hypothetical protein [Trichodesmium sp. St4_bin8_1]MDE5070817.1 hypothetical protein [Trichodesmium sp. St5_bin8]
MAKSPMLLLGVLGCRRNEILQDIKFGNDEEYYRYLKKNHSNPSAKVILQSC